jgi:hypothetical protein
MPKTSEFATPFWRSASKSLPAAVRKRYLPQLKSAERLDLALERVVGLFSRRQTD